MANIIDFDKARHREAQLNLPWYVAGELEAPERARFETHLAACPECQADVQFELHLRDEYPTASLEVEHDWAALQRSLGAQAPRPVVSLSRVQDRVQSWLRTGAAGRWLGAAVAAQAVLIVALVVATRPFADDQTYRALGAAADTMGATIVVTFRADATEQELRAALRESDARFVDGPLAAGGYLLRAPAGERDAVLAALRASAAVASAEPLDAGATQ